MPGINNDWKTDNYKYVGKTFDFAYANRMNKLLTIMSEVNSNSVDYEIAGTGGYGEYKAYDGSTLVHGTQKRGFKTIVTPGEYVNTQDVGYKQAKIDKLGETKKVGTRLGQGGAMTVYAHALRMFAGAYDPTKLGGDGKAWAAADHPVASKMSEGRKYIADTEAGTFSNLLTDELSVAAITKAQAMANRFTTPDGLPWLCDFDVVLVSPELEEKAKKLFGENARLMPNKDPESDTNASNAVYGMQYVVIGGGADGFQKKQWAVCDSTLMKELVNIVYITRPQVMQTELDNPLIDRYVGYIDFGLGWGDSRQIIFGNPA